MFRPIAAITAALLTAVCGVAGAETAHEFDIPNELGLDWPLELIYVDLPEGIDGPLVADFGGHVRPVQVEEAKDESGRSVRRAWMLATVERGTERLGVPLRPGRADSPLRLWREDGYLHIDNGVYSFRVPNYARVKLESPRPLSELPSPIAGMKLAGDDAWYGRSWWESDTPIAGATTTIISEGPVFVKVRLRLEAAEPVDGGEGFYEAEMRFVADDPWVDIKESYNLPDGSAHWLVLRDELKPEKVMWIPWFGFERFGGNTDLRFHDLRPQSKQRGPFVTLQPRWTQRPGAGQDFFVTRGGQTDPGDIDYDADSPAVGVIASYPTKWIRGPREVINAWAEEGDTARVEFSTPTGGRSYAVVVGERSRFDTTSRMNNIVRRHTDWTLNDQIHHYILSWQRD
ncbi:MAG: hypothetical protein ACOC8H_00455, partial [bacterium]